MASGPQRTRRQAFTLVELLVVIGIIAVLVSILLPVMGKAREQADAVRCASNLRQFAQANEVYVNETKGWNLPGYWDITPGGAMPGTSGYQYNRTWPGIYTFRRFLDMNIPDESPTSADPVAARNQRCYVDRDKWYCPTMNKEFTPNNITFDPSSNTFTLPMNYSYGMNVTGIDEEGRTPSALATPPPPQCLKGFHGYNRAQVRHPSDKLMFADCYGQALINVWGSGVFPGTNGKVANYDDTGVRGVTGTLPDGRAFDSTRTIAWRHRGTANVAFFDGHVGRLPKTDIYAFDNTGKIVPNWNLWDVMDVMH